MITRRAAILVPFLAKVRHMAGDGLVAPQNAPGGRKTPVGVQPGTSNTVVRARQVILSGNSPNEYLLAYRGNPGAGQLLASIAPQNGVDSYGNAYLQGVTSYAGINAVQINGFSVLWVTAATQAGPWTVAGGIEAIGSAFAISDGFTSIGGVINVPQSSSGITTVAQLVAVLKAGGILD